MLQPGVGGQLAGRRHHAPNDVAQGSGELRFVKPQLGELLVKAKLADGRQRGMLHAHRARSNQLERSQIDFLKAGRRSRRHDTGDRRRRPGGRLVRWARDELRRITLRPGFDDLG